MQISASHQLSLQLIRFHQLYNVPRLQPPVSRWTLATWRSNWCERRGSARGMRPQRLMRSDTPVNTTLRHRNASLTLLALTRFKSLRTTPTLSCPRHITGHLEAEARSLRTRSKSFATTHPFDSPC